MQADENQVALRVGAALLLQQGDEADRMNFLEDFDRIYGAVIPGWEAKIKEMLREMDRSCAEEAIQSVDAFFAKNHVYDENGNLIYSRQRVGGVYHTMTITFDASAPEGEQFKVEETPDFDSMSVEELEEYYEELESAYSDLGDEEPAEDSEEHKQWDDECEELENLMEAIQERIATAEYLARKKRQESGEDADA